MTGRLLIHNLLTLCPLRNAENRNRTRCTSERMHRGWMQYFALADSARHYDFKNDIVLRMAITCNCKNVGKTVHV